MVNICIDIGNSLIKLALFENNELKEMWKSPGLDVNKLSKLAVQFPLSKVIVSNVRKDYREIINAIFTEKRILYLDAQAHTNVKNCYKTPETLGADRLALACGAAALFPQKNCLVISAGTCLTLELITSKAEYLGGLIAPGIEIKRRGLNHYTGKLPELTLEQLWKYMHYNDFGTDTTGSLAYGIAKSTALEIEGWIAHFNTKYDNLQLILTGGDGPLLEHLIKYKIFAQPNLVLMGLNAILNCNENH